MSVNVPPTDSIGYNYAIARALFESRKFKKIIEDEILKIIYLQIDLILAYNNHPESALDKLKFIKDVFFKDYVNEQGQIGIPMIFVQGTGYKQIQTLNELTDTFIPSLNIREKMSMLKNFQSKENDCFMFSILIELSESISQGRYDVFEKNIICL